jgi:hypothetical protein
MKDDRPRKCWIALFTLAATVALGCSNSCFGEETPASAMASTNVTETLTTPPLEVGVDPRVELVSLLFRLAGNREYNQCRVPLYNADVEAQFGKFRDHPAVQLAHRLRQQQGVSYDACMGMAILLSNAFDPMLTERRPSHLPLSANQSSTSLW